MKAFLTKEFSWERVTPRYDLGVRPRVNVPSRRVMGWILVGAMILAPWVLAVGCAVRNYMHRI